MFYHESKECLPLPRVAANCKFSVYRYSHEKSLPSFASRACTYILADIELKTRVPCRRVVDEFVGNMMASLRDLCVENKMVQRERIEARANMHPGINIKLSNEYRRRIFASFSYSGSWFDECVCCVCMVITTPAQYRAIFTRFSQGCVRLFKDSRAWLRIVG